MDATTKYGSPAPHDANNYKVNQNNSTQFRHAGVYSSDTNQSGNFVITTDQVAKPGAVLPYSKNTRSTVYGSGAQYAVGA
jgi:hypothetical protein